MKVEVVVYNYESALIAEKCGANRVELCANEGAGGTSPSLALLQKIKENSNIEVFVMVRPREGDFTYSANEIDLILREIELFKQAGADGIVCAALKSDAQIDVPIVKKMVAAASPLPFTFHRAFDHVKDPFAALEQLIDCGCARILTSGQEPSVFEGQVLVKQLIQKANGRIGILPGAGVNSQNVKAIVDFTGCNEIHLSAKKMMHRQVDLNSKIQLGSANDSNSYQITDEIELMRVLEILG
jgi:copper homeostasis protein